MEKKFKILRFIGSLYKTLGIITAALTVIIALVVCGTSLLGGAALQELADQVDMGGRSALLGGIGGALAGIIGALVVALNGGLLSIGLYAIGEGIDLMLALEGNTRAMVSLLQKDQP